MKPLPATTGIITIIIIILKRERQLTTE